MFERAYPRALHAAKVRAIAAVARGVLPLDDHEDIEQEAVFACWRAVANFEPSRASLATFIECIVSTRIASLVREGNRLRALCPLDLAADHRGNSTLTRLELRIDVECLLGACSHGERRLALLLMEHSSSQASRILGVARSTVYERMRRVRRQFAAAGLGPSQRPGRGGNQR
jgi:RNA polymerase sigma factor (sigma-70 family)